MYRKMFFQKSLLGLAGLGLAGPQAREIPTEEKLGFNHLPLPETIRPMSNFILHKAETRGHANHGWLDSHHTFSFASYYNPERMRFGMLRVLNDDVVAGGMGFGTHPHENMEIISIPLAGDLEHRDSMGNMQVIRQGDIQVMSAGTGIQHSEYNRNREEPVRFLQIWVYPNRQGVKPRYDQIALDTEKMRNRWLQILSPTPDSEGVWIHQDAWFHRGQFSTGHSETYSLKKTGNGLYIFMIEGEATVNGQALGRRDGLGVTGLDSITLKAEKDSDILLMEVPMG